NGFFAALRDIVQLINPLTLKSEVAAIYDVVRSKIRLLDPTAIAGSIRDNVLTPLTAPLVAINPATIKAQLHAFYEALINALSASVKQSLDVIVGAVDELLRQLRAAVQTLLNQVEDAIKTTLHDVDEVLKQIDGMVFVEILGHLERVIDKLGV